MNKEDNFKEKFKQALISTVKVISDDYRPNIDKKNASSKNLNFFEFDNLNNRHDFIRLRAETDSEALKKKFSNKEIYQKNLPSNSSYRSLYNVSEKIRYELLGSRMLKGIFKNLNENYNQKLSLKRKDQLETKDDVNVVEAFELYMLKNFFNIKDMSCKFFSESFRVGIIIDIVSIVSARFRKSPKVCDEWNITSGHSFDGRDARSLFPNTRISKNMRGLHCINNF